MKKPLIAVAPATLLASPAFAKYKTPHSSDNSSDSFAVYTGPGSGAMAVDGNAVGADPGPSVSRQLMQDANLPIR